jgi:hypothetical protein
MKKLTTIATAVLSLALLAVPAGAGARTRDRNHDRIPDSWERAHHLSLRVNQARRDPDHDGLNNRAEFRAGLDPRDRDSDDDGVADSRENAGTVASFTGGVLTITLASGGTLSGQVTSQTEVQCNTRSEQEREDRDNEDSHRARAADAGEDDHGDDINGDRGDNQGDDNEQELEDDACPTGALAPGAIVHEADAHVTSAGLVFTKIELVA